MRGLHPTGAAVLGRQTETEGGADDVRDADKGGAGGSLGQQPGTQAGGTQADRSSHQGRWCVRRWRSEGGTEHGQT